MYELAMINGDVRHSTELYHHGILGQKWGVRRYQDKDGDYTEAGKRRRNSDGGVHYNRKHQLDSYKDYKKANKYAKATLKAKNREETKKLLKGEQKLGTTVLKKMANHRQYTYELKDNQQRMSMKARGQRVAGEVAKGTVKKAVAIGTGVAAVKAACSVGNALTNGMIKGKYGKTALATIGDSRLGRYEFQLDKKMVAKELGKVALASLAASVTSEALNYAKTNDKNYNKTGNYTLDKHYAAEAKKDRDKWKKGEY